MLLERKGARVVLCATAGAEDVLELRRQERASLYDLTRHHAPPLVPPQWTVAIDERITPYGVEKPLSARAMRDAVTAVRAAAPEVVAIALLHSYRDESHERALAKALREDGIDADIVCSADVLPEIREYERTTTTVAEAYLRPGVARYLARLGERLRAQGYPSLSVMTSSGGMRGAVEAGEERGVARALGTRGRRRGRGVRRAAGRFPERAHDRHRRHERGCGTRARWRAAHGERRRDRGRADRVATRARGDGVRGRRQYRLGGRRRRAARGAAQCGRDSRTGGVRARRHRGDGDGCAHRARHAHRAHDRRRCARRERCACGGGAARRVVGCDTERERRARWCRRRMRRWRAHCGA